MLLSKINNKYISYVGYTKDINNRVLLHNNSKGAKFTKGNFWKIIYKKKYLTKNLAMIEEYKLKKNYKKRSLIKIKYLKKNSLIK
tara:strand:- start:3188 stop:3442 length:255 start_codon:yes stop_codon:yes gene_type:complete